MPIGHGYHTACATLKQIWICVQILTARCRPVAPGMAARNAGDHLVLEEVSVWEDFILGRILVLEPAPTVQRRLFTPTQLVLWIWNSDVVSRRAHKLQDSIQTDCPRQSCDLAMTFVDFVWVVSGMDEPFA